MPHNKYSEKWWFGISVKLTNLGYFKLQKNLSANNFNYNALVVYQVKNSYMVNKFLFFNSLKKIYPLILNTIINSGTFFFISLGESGLMFFKNFFTILQKTYINIIFDWGFGILTNKVRLFLNYCKTGKFCFEEFPDVVFLLSILDRQRVVTTELRRGGILSIGLADYANSSYVDYPLAANISLQYLYFFFRLVLKLIVKEQQQFSFFRRKK